MSLLLLPRKDSPHCRGCPRPCQGSPHCRGRPHPCKGSPHCRGRPRPCQGSPQRRRRSRPGWLNSTASRQPPALLCSLLAALFCRTSWKLPTLYPHADHRAASGEREPRADTRREAVLPRNSAWASAPERWSSSTETTCSERFTPLGRAGSQQQVGVTLHFI